MQVELTPVELPDEPVEEAETLVSVCDTESTQCDEDQTAPIPVYDTVAEVRCANALLCDEILLFL